MKNILNINLEYFFPTYQGLTITGFVCLLPLPRLHLKVHRFDNPCTKTHQRKYRLLIVVMPTALYCHSMYKPDDQQIKYQVKEVFWE